MFEVQKLAHSVNKGHSWSFINSLERNHCKLTGILSLTITATLTSDMQ